MGGRPSVVGQLTCVVGLCMGSEILLVHHCLMLAPHHRMLLGVRLVVSLPPVWPDAWRCCATSCPLTASFAAAQCPNPLPCRLPGPAVQALLRHALPIDCMQIRLLSCCI